MADKPEVMPVLGPLADQARFKRPVGRPRKAPQLSNLLRALPSVEERIVSDPEGYDPATFDKILSLQCRINLERALKAGPNDKDAAFYLRKAAVTVQVLQLLEGSKSVVWNKTDDKKYPTTMADLDKEMAARDARLKKLAPYVIKSVPTPPAPVEPKATEPPAES